MTLTRGRMGGIVVLGNKRALVLWDVRKGSYSIGISLIKCGPCYLVGLYGSL